MTNLPSTVSHTISGASFLAISSREISELTGKLHKNVLRDIRTMLAAIHDTDPQLFTPDKILENQESSNLSLGISSQIYGHNNSGKPVYEYLLNKDLTLTLLTGYDAKARFKVVRRWCELETQHPIQPALPDFTNPIEAARAWADQAERAQEAERLALSHARSLEKAKPKVMFYKRVAASDQLFSMAEVAKTLGIGRNRLFAFLRNIGVIERSSRLPYQKYCDMHLFRVRIKEHNTYNGHREPYPQTYVTLKGVQFIQSKLDELALEKVAR